MAGKAAVLPLIADHVRTLRHAGEDHIRKRDVATHYVIPALTGALFAMLGLRLQDATQVIAGASILAGFSFGLAVFVFQLRLESGRDPRIHKGDLLLELLDELFDNICYLIASGLLLVGLAIAGTSVTTEPAAVPSSTTTASAVAVVSTDSTLNGWWTAILIALSLHYAVTLLMCLKRLRRAYQELTI